MPTIAAELGRNVLFSDKLPIVSDHRISSLPCKAEKLSVLDNRVHIQNGMVRVNNRNRLSVMGKKSKGSSEKLCSNDEGDFYLDDHDVVSDDLSCFRGLVLDISYRPVNVICWKRAIVLEFLKKADVLEYYSQTVSSAVGSFYIPAVLRVPQLFQVVKRRIKHRLNRRSILYRDFVHLPVTACAKCNSRKGHNTLEETNMKLMKVPKAPKDYDVLTIPLSNASTKMLRRRNGWPDEWRQYLPPSSLEL